MKRTATDDGNGQSKLARDSSREEYCKMLEEMLNEYDEVTVICKNAKNNFDSNEKKQARARMIALINQLKSIEIFVLILIQPNGCACASEKFLTNEEASKSEETWKQIPLMKTFISTCKVWHIEAIRPLLQMKIVEKPNFTRSYFHFKFQNGDQLDSCCICVAYSLYDELIVFLEEKKKNLKFDYWVMYDSIQSGMLFAVSNEDFKLKFENCVAAKITDQ